MMGMFVVHGAQAGGFSPISIYGVITNSVMEDAGLPSSEITVFLASLVVNTIMAAILFVVLGGRKLMAHARSTPTSRRHARRGPAPRRRDRPGPAACGTGAPATGTAGPRRAPRPGPHPARLRRRRRSSRWSSTRTSASSRSPPPCILAMLTPNEHKDAVKQIAWPTVLLVAGVSTYATILTTAGSPEFVGNWAAGLGAVADRRADPLLRRRRRLGVRLVDGAAAGHHPDRRAAHRRRRHQRRPLRGRARGHARRSSTSARSRPTAR